MDKLEKLAELLAAELQWPSSEANAQVAYTSAAEFDVVYKALELDVATRGATCYNDVFLALSSRLGSLAAALQQDSAGAELDGVLGTAFCMQAGAACLAFNVLLACVEGWSEGEWLRLLTAAVIPLKVLPPILLALARVAATDSTAAAAAGAAASDDLGPSTHISCSTQIRILDRQLQCMSEAVYRLCKKAFGEEDESVPERVKRAVRSAQLKPARLIGWVRCVAQTAIALRAAGGRDAHWYMSVISCLLLHTEQTDLAARLAVDLPAQHELLYLADSWLLLPAGELAAAVADPDACKHLGHAVQLAERDCLKQGRQSREILNVGGRPGQRANLLQALASLAVLPQLVDRHGNDPVVAGLLIEALGLLAALVADAAAYERAYGEAVPAQYSSKLLLQLGSPGGLPLLCQLAAEVAAASGEAKGSWAEQTAAAAARAAQASARPASSGSRDGGRDSGSDRDKDSCGGDEAGSAATFGSLCWRRHQGHFWVKLLGSWVLSLRGLKLAPVWAARLDGPSAAAGLRAAEALLRLAAVSPHQPATCTPDGDGWLDAGHVAAAFTGLSRAPALCLLGEAACEAAGLMLRAPRAAPASLRTTAAAFAALATACRCMHAACAAAASTQLSSSSGSGGGTSATGVHFAVLLPASGSSFPLLSSALHDALLTFHILQYQRVQNLPAGVQAEQAVRQLECGMLLYLAAIAAATCRTREASKGTTCCNMLATLLKEAALAPLWRQVLGPGGGDGDVAAAAGMDATQLIVDLAVVALEAAFGAPATPGAPGPFEQREAALRMVQRALELGPCLAARLADHSMLLRALSRAGEVLLEDRRRTQAVRLLTSTLCALLRQLAPHMPAVMTDRLAGLQPAGNVERSKAALDSLGRYADALLRGEAASEQQQQQQRRRRHPLGPEAQALAVRRAQALACCTGCANPCCSNLAGTSEAAAKGKLCSGCRTVRFCSPACSKEEWAQHKWACQLLGAA